jgi:Flp pilus assembly pilin Flp
MARKISPGNFLKDDQGVVSVEYVVFVAAIAICLIAGIVALMNGMSSYFNSWAAFFSGTGT